MKVISGDNPRDGRRGRRAGRALDAGDGRRRRGDLPEDPEALADALEAHTVFGRVTPQQKRAMVEALQSRGHVVAMTGDGVNDVLALKDADIGVAMGSGSRGHAAVAQLVLLDGDFAALPAGGGRGAPGHRQRRAGREPVPDQDRVRDAARAGGRGGRPAVPVPAPPPDAASAR